ncbi:DNA polymerase III subunit gamma/tau [Buchnera aphidicola (Chaitoregma tattakana)]|uniref:DNA polymerase III subunit gamma/tau n=1 Tax=Buchnera aphidicola TaxID=9 RepID=UPI0031B8713C
MKYEILARKYRPKCFKEIIGQKYIVKSIHNSLETNKIHQSWIFSGNSGIGKTTISRLLAKSLSCEKGITYFSCLKCKNCIEILKGCFIDLIEIDAASKTKVEEIKKILENVKYLPVKGRFKIYIIDEVHMLSKHSFNALLKILEEPPIHVKFILATTNINKIPETIISRCICFYLNHITEKQIYKYLKNILKKEKIKIEKNIINIIYEASKGNVRSALNIIEQSILLNQHKITEKNVINILGIIEQKKILLLTKYLIKKELNKTFHILKKINISEYQWHTIFDNILKLLHHIAILKKFGFSIEKHEYMKNYRNNIIKIVKNTKFSEIQRCYHIIIKGKREIEISPNSKICAEMTFLRILEKDN